MNKIPILNKKCPICGHPASLDYQPFCSKKCADIDLGRWLKGNYIIETNEAPTPEEWAEIQQNSEQNK